MRCGLAVRIGRGGGSGGGGRRKANIKLRISTIIYVAVHIITTFIHFLEHAVYHQWSFDRELCSSLWTTLFFVLSAVYSVQSLTNFALPSLLPQTFTLFDISDIHVKPQHF